MWKRLEQLLHKEKKIQKLYTNGQQTMKKCPATLFILDR